MDNKIWKGLAIFLTAVFVIAAGFKAVDDQYLLWKNIVPNPGFENGIGDWTTSGGTLATTTTAANVGNGSVALSFDPSAGSQIAENGDIAIPPGLYGEACALFVRYKGGGTANITIEANNGSTLGTAITVSSAATNYTMARSQFTCPTSGNLHIEMTSAGDAAELFVDDFWIGRDILTSFGGGGGGDFGSPNDTSAHIFSIHYEHSSGTPQTDTTADSDADSVVSSYTDLSTGKVRINLNSGTCTTIPICAGSHGQGNKQLRIRREYSATTYVQTTSFAGASESDSDSMVIICKCED